MQSSQMTSYLFINKPKENTPFYKNIQYDTQKITRCIEVIHYDNPG